MRFRETYESPYQSASHLSIFDTCSRHLDTTFTLSMKHCEFNRFLIASKILQSKLVLHILTEKVNLWLHLRDCSHCIICQGKWSFVFVDLIAKLWSKMFGKINFTTNFDWSKSDHLNGVSSFRLFKWSYSQRISF